MSTHAILLLTLAAALHATWNLLGKRHAPSAALLTLSNAAAAVLLLPVAVHFRRVLPAVPAGVWTLVLLTGLANAVYFTALAGAYRSGHLSVAYPLVRAVPVLLVTGFSLLVGAGRALGPTYWGGIVLVVAGCFLLPMPRWRRLRLREHLGPTGAWALVAAVATAAYTIIDNRAMAQLRRLGELRNAEAAVLYAMLEASSVAVCLATYSLLWPPERQRLSSVVRRSKLQAAVIGAAIYLGYGLVLASMAYVDDVSYVMAFRQLSIPMGVALGLGVLREPRSRPGLVGAGLVFLGLVLVALG